MNSLLKVFSLHKSFSFYQSYFIRSQILENLSNGPTSIIDIIPLIHKSILDKHKDLLWKTTINDVGIELLNLFRLGFIKLVDDSLILTAAGMNANRTALFHTLYTNSFTTHKSLIISFWGLLIALAALIVSVAALFQ